VPQFSGVEYSIEVATKSPHFLLIILNKSNDLN
jgi:hypothetical protein